MNIAIVGSRNFGTDTFTHRRLVEIAIEELIKKYGDVTIVSGGARGADTLGEMVARSYGLPTIIHLPKWNRENGSYNPRAGFERNALIVRDADIVVAFYAPGPKSRGTTDTVSRAKLAGKTVHVYHEGEWSK